MAQTELLTYESSVALNKKLFLISHQGIMPQYAKTVAMVVMDKRTAPHCPEVTSCPQSMKRYRYWFFCKYEDATNPDLHKIPHDTLGLKGHSDTIHQNLFWALSL